MGLFPVPGRRRPPLGLVSGDAAIRAEPGPGAPPNTRPAPGHAPDLAPLILDGGRVTGLDMRRRYVRAAADLFKAGFSPGAIRGALIALLVHDWQRAAGLKPGEGSVRIPDPETLGEFYLAASEAVREAGRQAGPAGSLSET